MSKLDKFYFWLAWYLPKGLAYWCYIRVASYATSKYPDKTPDEINIMQALACWNSGKNHGN
jgi:hypothetical protein